MLFLDLRIYGVQVTPDAEFQKESGDVIKGAFGAGEVNGGITGARICSLDEMGAC